MKDWFADAADRYDASLGDEGEHGAIEAVVDVLAELADGGAALELGIGTGRIALPLAARGVPVSGIDLSEPMVAQLRAKPGGAELPVAVGDMSSARVEGTFRLVYLVFNTIMNLTSQEEQVACFENAARHLEPGGSFLIECMLPDLRRLPYGERLVLWGASGTHVGIDEYDVATQALVSHHYGQRHQAMPFRYVWPAELDLMARIAGLRLRARWADWSRAPFTNESRGHVSIWERPDRRSTLTA